MFSKEIADVLQHYVYRLIDPRNGETFYVGKGVGNRLFAHVKGELDAGDDGLNQKIQRIREIRLAGFEVAHVVHRHGLDSATAFEVEAALIDAYPAVTNLVGGHGSDERGVMHSRQIIERYEAPVAEFLHRVMIININRSATERDSAYEAVRYAWKIDVRKARAVDFVLAAQQGLIVGAYVADEWMQAKPLHFPGTTEERVGRWGFVGRDAPDDIWKLYVRKRVPDAFRKQGAANPIRYAGPDLPAAASLT